MAKGFLRGFICKKWLEMYLVTWNAQYSIGIDELDEHHRHLIFSLNKIYDIFVNEASAWDLAQVFDALTDYAQHHFTAEESLMQKWDYPDFDTHRILHNQFVERLKEKREIVCDCNHRFAFELLTFLNSWLLSHILNADAKFGKFLAVKKCQQAA